MAEREHPGGPREVLDETKRRKVLAILISGGSRRAAARYVGCSPGTRLLVDQLRQFPVADHDDGPGALEMAVRAAWSILSRPPDDGLGHRLWLGI